MEPYLLLLLLIPSTAAFVDCRTACRTCRQNKQPPEMLEVYCSMCEECKERRREKMMEKMKHSLKEGPPVALNQEIPHTSETTTSNYPEMHFPDSPQRETNQEIPAMNLPQIQNLNDPMLDPSPEVDGCPVQTPCSDEEEPTTPGIKKLHYSTTTTTTTTTTKKPCPIPRPCRKKITTTPQRILPPSLPPPPPGIIPSVPIIPPQYPVNNCFMPNVQTNPCPGYPYMNEVGHMAPGMLPAPVAPGYIYQPYIPGPKGHYGTQRGSSQVNHQDSFERHEPEGNTERVPSEFISGKQTASIVRLTGTPRTKKLNAEKDFVYVYVGVPKNMKS